MREIKFRAWDKIDKVMREVYGIQFPKISNHGDRKNTIIEMHCSDYEGQRAIILSDFTDNVERVELMQFTGLLDKNGKEIYEGDIVEFEPLEIKGENRKYIGEITFGFGEFRALVIGLGKLSFYQNYSEIIGNIYENQDLLK